MYRCSVCGSLSPREGACGLCGGALREIQANPTAEHTATQKPRRFWMRTKTIALTALVLVAISAAGTGVYLTARTGSCTNRAVNYPGCTDCGPMAKINTSTNSCSCTNSTVDGLTYGRNMTAVNPPACDRFCSNNAINPPKCDLCPDNHTDIICPPGSPPRQIPNPDSGLRYSFTPISPNAFSNI